MKNSKGFTLIELIVVITVVGILAAIAIPNYFNYLAKSQQVEARANLSAIYVGVLSYSAPKESDGFQGATLESIGFTAGGTSRYNYTLAIVTTNTFLARANGISGRVTGDVWEINHERALKDVDENSFNH